MNKNIYFLLFALITSISFSQEKIKGNRNVTTIKTELDNFKKIIIGEDFEVKLVKNESAAIEIETDENLHDVIQFNVVDSTFHIKTNKKIRSKKRLNITLYFTSALNDIELNTDAELEGINTVEVKNLFLTINDYAKAELTIKSENFKLVNNNKSRIQLNSRTKLDIESPKVNLTLNESSNTETTIKTIDLEVFMKRRATLRALGNTNFLKVTAIESTDFLGEKLSSIEANIVARDNAEYDINSTKEITISASQNSSIKLFGNAKITLSKFTDKAKILKK